MPTRVFAQETEDTPSPIVLRISHNLAQTETSAAFFFQPWARNLSAQTDNAIVVEYLGDEAFADPGQRLAAILRGEIDGALIPLQLIAPQAPAVTALELPMLFPKDPVLASKAAWRFVREHVAEEMPTMTVMAVYSDGAMALHTKGRRMSSAQRFEKLVAQVPGPQAEAFLTVLGSKPLIMPIADAPRAFARSQIEGAFAPWHIMSSGDPLKGARRHMELGGDKALFMEFHAFVIGNHALARLNPELREAVMAGAGERASMTAGQAIATGIEVGRANIARQPRSVMLLSEADLAPLQRAASQVQGTWLRTMREVGHPAKVWLLDLNKYIAGSAL